MRPLQHAVPAVVAELLRVGPLSQAKAAFAWRAAVGAGLDRGAAVRLEGRTLVVEPASAQWARELARSRGVIHTRLRALLGPDAIDDIIIRTP